jgi:hypothetical protein
VDDGKGGHACAVEHLVGPGERCDLAAGGAIIGCASGSYCGPGADPSTSICIAAASAGGTCNPSFQGSCGDGLACDSTTSKCRAPLGLGDACFNSVPCATGLYCTNSGVCAEPTKEGAACQVYDRCADGLACISGECTPLLDNGQSCTWAGQCKSERCDLSSPSYDSGTCTAQAGAVYHFPDGMDASICFDLAPQPTDSGTSGAHP